MDRRRHELRGGGIARCIALAALIGACGVATITLVPATGGTRSPAGSAEPPILSSLSPALLPASPDPPDSPAKPDDAVHTNPSTPALVDFNRDIRPILTQHCALCHGPDPSSRKADLRLDERDGAVSPRGDRPPVIVPGEPQASELIRRVTERDPGLRMPPEGRDALTPREVDLLRRWIEQGATYARHWSFEPIINHPAPAVRNQHWPRDPVDRFILRALEDAKLVPGDEADKRTLIRRITFDLTGLPPTVEEVEAFVNDASPDAYERVVDRLLASPRFGERWARHWLDLMRYAETHGHEFDYPIRHAWQYRDYVIRALNADVPYDQFVREHLAGDLMNPPRTHPTEGSNESIIGTGWWYLSQGTHGPVDVRLDTAERIDNQIDVLSKSFLGLTVSCARCHDHKFDPIPTRDYYALAGFMRSTHRQEAYLDPGGRIGQAMFGVLRAADASHRVLRDALPTPDRVRETPIDRLLLASREVLSGEPKPTDPPIPATDIVFEDFEHGTYEGWEVEGTAFGPGPWTQDTLARYQGDVGAQGRFFVNTHNTRNGEDVRQADVHHGTLTSREFIIEKPFIHFLIDGGNHAGKTCINLLVDGKVVRTATGRNSNRFHRETWEVRDLAGKAARIQVVDRESGGWGQIGVDHIVFSDSPQALPPLRRPVEAVAAEFEVDAALLGRWVDVVRSPAASEARHPLNAWTSIAMRPEGGDAASIDRAMRERADHWRRSEAEAQARREQAHLFDDFKSLPFFRWSSTGWAFGVGPLRGDQLQPVAGRLRLAPRNVPDSGALARGLQGTLRSGVFTISHRNIHFRLRGQGARVRVIVEGYFLDEFNALLFEGMTADINTPDDDQWHHHRVFTGNYLGRQAHIEIIDDGPGWIAVDEVWFSDDDAPPWNLAPRPMRDTPAASLEDLARVMHEHLATAVRSALSSRGDGHDHAVFNLLFDLDLLNAAMLPPPALAFDPRRPEDRPGWTDARRVLLEAHQRFVEAGRDIPAPMRVLAVTDLTSTDEYIFIRGSHRTLGEIAPRRFLTALAGDDQPRIQSGSGRLELANRLLDSSNPLPSRVAVNRVWLHLFGAGLVPTPDDFGGLGQPPTHPELLDHLAHWFATENRWSIKGLIRRLVLTSTYRMATDPTDPAAEQADPTNALYHRANLRRLQGEAIRDAMLAVSGRLDATMFGPPVPIHLTPFMDGRGRPGRSGPLDGAGRRSIYQEVRRNFLSPFMLTFDTPVPHSTVGRRNVSNVPAQALILMNDPFVVEQAGAWARRLLADASLGTDEALIERAYREAFGRSPTIPEKDAALGFLARQVQEHQGRDDRQLVSARERSWADLCHALFNVKEFVFLR